MFRRSFLVYINRPEHILFRPKERAVHVVPLVFVQIKIIPVIWKTECLRQIRIDDSDIRIKRYVVYIGKVLLVVLETELPHIQKIEAVEFPVHVIYVRIMP